MPPDGGWEKTYTIYLKRGWYGSLLGLATPLCAKYEQRPHQGVKLVSTLGCDHGRHI